ncbi:MAG: DUF932 domain-containing protein [Oscillatoriales cyanobacterium C42_A2020_001]|nr:DUF932 domain-containing protein [Leptolyngbyaceae cyanobacterium C42_A2020_001]
MAHEFESGFFVAQAAWHRLGTVLQNPPTVEDAIVKAGLDWRVLEEPIIETGEETPTLRKHLIRDRDRQLLGTVVHNYVPLQNEDAFHWFDPLLHKGCVKLEAAGSLQRGQRVWILARICNLQAEVRYDDLVCPYLLLHNSHNGSTAAWIQFTPIRVVCMNTLAGATVNRFGDLGQKKAICIPHTLTLHEQLARIQTLVDLTKREFQFSVEEYLSMENQELTDELLTAYLGSVLGVRNPARHPAWEQLLANFESGRGNQGKTLWDAYNAVTEWLEHQRETCVEARLISNWFGAGATLRIKAHTAAIALLKHQTPTSSLTFAAVAGASSTPLR